MEKEINGLLKDYLRLLKTAKNKNELQVPRFIRNPRLFYYNWTLCENLCKQGLLKYKACSYSKVKYYSITEKGVEFLNKGETHAKV
jgi:predicted transcriptional regulator